MVFTFKESFSELKPTNLRLLFILTNSHQFVALRGKSASLPILSGHRSVDAGYCTEGVVLTAVGYEQPLVSQAWGDDASLKYSLGTIAFEPKTLYLSPKEK